MLRSKSNSIQRTSCPKCGECPFIDGVCEQKIARGRRFFLMGALALPVAAKIERVAQALLPAPAPALNSITFSGEVWVWQARLEENNGAWHVDDVKRVLVTKSFAVAENNAIWTPLE